MLKKWWVLFGVLLCGFCLFKLYYGQFFRFPTWKECFALSTSTTTQATTTKSSSTQNFVPRRRCIISMTTIPDRLFSPIFPQRLYQLSQLDYVDRIILHVPTEYRHFSFPSSSSPLPEWTFSFPKLFINQQSPDFGPATKWLGLVSCPPNWFEFQDQKEKAEIWLAVMDDDIVYSPSYFHHLWNWLENHPSFHDSSDHITIYVNHVMSREEYQEWSGFAGCWGRLSDMLSAAQDFLQTWLSHTSNDDFVEEHCWRVDDTYLSWIAMKNKKINIVPTFLDLSLLIDFQESDNHPIWPELKYTSREIDTHECLQSLQKKDLIRSIEIDK